MFTAISRDHLLEPCRKLGSSELPSSQIAAKIYKIDNQPGPTSWRSLGQCECYVLREKRHYSMTH